MQQASSSSALREVRHAAASNGKKPATVHAIDCSPTDEQEKAIAAISHWYRAKTKKQYFHLAGYAGTGKTTVIRHVVQALGIRSMLYAAYTNRAALILEEMGSAPAQTVHSLIYTCNEIRDPETGQTRLVAFKNTDSCLKNVDLCIVDECSMLSEEIIEDLLSFGTPVLFVGDPGQLPPIRRTLWQGFETADATLSQVHRQAKESAIIRLATRARFGKEIEVGDYSIGDGYTVVKSAVGYFDPEYLATFDQVIVGQHVHRHAINDALRKHFRYTEPYPQSPGIKLVGMRNDTDVDVRNGEIYFTVDGHSEQADDRFSINLKSETRLYPTLWCRKFEFDRKKPSKSDPEPFWKSGILHLDWGYAITAHKAQGSQWGSVAVIDDWKGGRMNATRRKWLYTAITRAAHSLAILDVNEENGSRS
jgi:ATP-dependent exoDNAse (exonuclease V) alpha subunit